MKKNDLHFQIESLLGRMTAHNQTLKAHEGRFSQLETDMLRKQCIELYDAINQLHMANMMDKVTVTEVKKEAAPILEMPAPVVEKDVIDHPEKIEEEKKAPVVPERVEPPMVVEVKPEEAIEKTPPKEVPRAQVIEMPHFVPVVEKPTPVYSPPIPKPVDDGKSVLEKINEQNSSTTLHDSMAMKKEEKELAHHFANSKIETIKQAIDISKRFELQSNLFLADSQSYTQAIADLENAGDKSIALDIFDRLAKQFHWNAENELVMELKSFIYRKY